MRLLRAADHRLMPWKNGGGATTELAISPPGAGLDAFDWRISMADVVEDGPFSTFDGIDRSLAIIGGDGILLDIEGRPGARLTRASAPLAFPADTPAQCRLIGGRVRDLNVMSRRDAFRHRLGRIVTAGPYEVAPSAEVTLIVSRSAGLGIACNGEHTELGIDDAVLIDTPAQLTPSGASEFYLIELFRTDGAASGR
ncbi:HutD/Ves family protein [Ancylobacter defluvii]|uniref:HutD-family protein n=1 Tax=Ancylobacter defluvii TaxID=1282440 RepID=A0A9W6JT93_9HYPH|nr:HutD family protein [Ancylobacter defluvii]MBS7590493.1 HutD family protein [Ancylobacter defluvii]GLK83415.1 hypothetical protein GCM10017653_14840 [Ancylobacter defluvii]